MTIPRIATFNHGTYATWKVNGATPMCIRLSWPLTKPRFGSRQPLSPQCNRKWLTVGWLESSFCLMQSWWQVKVKWMGSPFFMLSDVDGSGERWCHSMLHLKREIYIYIYIYHYIHNYTQKLTVQFQKKSSCSLRDHSFGSKKNGQFLFPDTFPEDGWNTRFLLGWPIFRCHLSFRECKAKGVFRCFFLAGKVLGPILWGSITWAITVFQNERSCHLVFYLLAEGTPFLEPAYIFGRDCLGHI